jgi:hypothetical protein
MSDSGPLNFYSNNVICLFPHLSLLPHPLSGSSLVPWTINTCPRVSWAPELDAFSTLCQFFLSRWRRIEVRKRKEE